MVILIIINFVSQPPSVVMITFNPLIAIYAKTPYIPLIVKFPKYVFLIDINVSKINAIL